MPTLKVKALIGVSLAVVLSACLLGISIFVTPNNPPSPFPVTSWPNQLMTAVYWLAIALIFSGLIFGAWIVAGKIKRKN